jgi:hypothetical protein
VSQIELRNCTVSHIWRIVKLISVCVAQDGRSFCSHAERARARISYTSNFLAFSETAHMICMQSISVMNSVYFTHDQAFNVIGERFLCATHRKLISRPLNFERRRRRIKNQMQEAQGQKERGKSPQWKRAAQVPRPRRALCFCGSSKSQLYINTRGNPTAQLVALFAAAFWNMISEAFLRRDFLCFVCAYAARRARADA